MLVFNNNNHKKTFWWLMSITKKLFGDWCQSQKEFGQSLKKISEYWKTARDTKRSASFLLMWESRQNTKRSSSFLVMWKSRQNTKKGASFCFCGFFGCEKASKTQKMMHSQKGAFTKRGHSPSQLIRRWTVTFNPYGGKDWCWVADLTKYERLAGLVVWSISCTRY